MALAPRVPDRQLSVECYGHLSRVDVAGVRSDLHVIDRFRLRARMDEHGIGTGSFAWAEVITGRWWRSLTNARRRGCARRQVWVRRQACGKRSVTRGHGRVADSPSRCVEDAHYERGPRFSGAGLARAVRKSRCTRRRDERRRHASASDAPPSPHPPRLPDHSPSGEHRAAVMYGAASSHFPRCTTCTRALRRTRRGVSVLRRPRTGRRSRTDDPHLRRSRSHRHTVASHLSLRISMPDPPSDRRAHSGRSGARRCVTTASAVKSKGSVRSRSPGSARLRNAP